MALGGCMAYYEDFSKLNKIYNDNFSKLEKNCIINNKDYDKIYKEIYTESNTTLKPNQALKDLMRDAQRIEEERLQKATDDADVSEDLPEDAAAKLQLLHGDCVVIPRDKLKEYIEKATGRSL